MCRCYHPCLLSFKHSTKELYIHSTESYIHSKEPQVHSKELFWREQHTLFKHTYPRVKIRILEVETGGLACESTSTNCNTLQHTAAHCSTLQCTATHSKFGSGEVGLGLIPPAMQTIADRRHYVSHCCSVCCGVCCRVCCSVCCSVS